MSEANEALEIIQKLIPEVRGALYTLSAIGVACLSLFGLYMSQRKKTDKSEKERAIQREAFEKERHEGMLGMVKDLKTITDKHASVLEKQGELIAEFIVNAKSLRLEFEAVSRENKGTREWGDWLTIQMKEDKKEINKKFEDVAHEIHGVKESVKKLEQKIYDPNNDAA